MNPAETHALIVGIETYAAGRAWDLKGPAQDGINFADWLIENCVPTTQITYFLNAVNADDLQNTNAHDPTENNIRNWFEIELPKISPKNLIIFWGGHGFIAKGERRLYTADAKETLLKHLNLNDLLLCLQSEYYQLDSLLKQWVVVDSCANFISPTSEKNLPIYQFPSKKERQLEQFVHLAARHGQFATNTAGVRFSCQLMQLLKGRSLPLDFKELADELKNVFENLTGPTSARNSQKTYYMYKGLDGEYKIGTTPFEKSTIPNAASNLDEDQLARLSQALSEVCSSQKALSNLVCHLPFVMKTQIDVPSLIQLLSRVPDGLHELEALTYQQSGSKGAMDAFHAALQDVFHHPVTWAEVAELRNMPELFGLPTQILAGYFRLVTKNRFSGATDDTSLEHYLHWLSRESCNVDDAPLLAFLYLCLPHLAPENTLERWIQQVCRRLEIQPELIEKRAIRLRKQSIGPATLLIKVAPSLQKPELFLVKGWALRQNKPAQLLYESAEKPLQKTELLPTFQLLVGAINTLLVHDEANFRVELILPLELLDLNLDNWEVTRGRRKVACGAVYISTLRSWERFYDVNYKSIMHEWKRKWDALPKKGELLPEDQIFWATRQGDIPNPNSVEAKKPIFAALTMKTPKNRIEDTFYFMIETGMPIGVWLQEEIPEGQACIQTLLRQPLDNLALMVQEKKWNGEKALGSQLSLFWDDPNDKPPDVDRFLASPNQRGNV